MVQIPNVCPSPLRSRSRARALLRIPYLRALNRCPLLRSSCKNRSRLCGLRVENCRRRRGSGPNCRRLPERACRRHTRLLPTRKLPHTLIHDKLVEIKPIDKTPCLSLRYLFAFASLGRFIRVEGAPKDYDSFPFPMLLAPATKRRTLYQHQNETNETTPKKSHHRKVLSFVLGGEEGFAFICCLLCYAVDHR